MKRDIQERIRFFRSFLANPRQVGAVLPTSRWAVRDMLDMTDLPQARHVALLGAGTGAETGEILKRLRPDARFLAFEIDPDLSAVLSERFEDPRLEIINDSAENIEDYLDGAKMDVIVSAIPFTSLPQDAKQNVFREAARALAPEGVMVLIQYSTVLQRDLTRRFASVRRRVSPLNVPPAFLYACRSPLPQEALQR
ncbi:MAG TPA: methyltransferase domain-containing protein [Rubrobacteraceae bacterium]|jgi:phospholipid N-methyltransferase|nr:methyltransferase domain-containing protein [Rubrobacteraceae bacterium]